MSRYSIESIHSEITQRLERGNGRFDKILSNWIKFEDNSDRLYKARGLSGENYLLNRLGAYEIKNAQWILSTISDTWDQQSIDTFLNSEDAEGNGVWHYLADNLRRNEGKDTLRMAHTLLQFDINFTRRNKQGISPLGKMLLPEPKWQSINALIQTRHLQIGNIEAAIAEHAKGDDRKKASMMSWLFQKDLSANRALLSQHILKQATKSNQDAEHRRATCRLFFDYVDERDGTTAFFKLIRVANRGMFEDLLRILLLDTEDTVQYMAPPDVATKKAYRQAVLCKRLLKLDRRGESVLFHCLHNGALEFLRKMTGFLVNDEIAMKKRVRGEEVRTPITIDKNAPAPANPLLCALLHRNRRGDTLFHIAARKGDREALEAFCFGLPSNDIYAIFTRLPDAAGLTLADLTEMQQVKAKLTQAVKNGKLKKDAAQAFLKEIANANKDGADFILSKKSEIEELASDTTGGAPLAPNFDLKKATQGQSAPAAA